MSNPPVFGARANPGLSSLDSEAALANPAKTGIQLRHSRENGNPAHGLREGANPAVFHGAPDSARAGVADRTFGFEFEHGLFGA